MLSQIYDFFYKLLDSGDWPPRWSCGHWSDFHGWLYIVSDLLIWSAYFAIPVIIISYMRRKDIAFPRLYVLFAAFILACGLTHFVDALMFWVPVYRLSALIRFGTGVVSWFTALSLVQLLPVAFSQRTSKELEREIEQRKAAEAALLENNKVLQRMESELRQKTRELERRVADLQRFAFVASHDLKEPLRKIGMFASMLQQQYGTQLPGRSSEYVDKIVASAERNQQLVEDLLLFARLGNEKPEYAETDLTELATEAIADLEVLISETGAHIDLEPLPRADVVPLQIKQLLQNLLANAIKFRRPDVPARIRVWGEITPRNQTSLAHDDPTAVATGFSLDENEPCCRIYVADNGRGFEPEYRDAIFEIFRRMHSGIHGTGLGLAIVRRIVENHGGVVEADGKPDEGATFVVTLPLRQRKEVRSER